MDSGLRGKLQVDSDGRVSVGLLERLDPIPLHAVDTADGKVCELGERRGREVKVTEAAADTTVGDHDFYRLALEGCPGLALANRVVVRVNTIVTREVIVKLMRDCGDEVGVLVGNTART